MRVKQEKLDELRKDMLQETYLRNNSDAFRDFTEEEHSRAIEAIRFLKNLYNMYGHDFVLKDLEDEIKQKRIYNGFV